MPSKEEEDRNAKRKAREDRSKHSSGTSTSSRRDSSDRREKDRARKGRDGSQSSAPRAFAATKTSPSRSKKSSVKASGAIDRSGRSQGHSSRSAEGKSRPSSGKSRNSKPATVPGAVTSSDKSRASGKSRHSKPASTPGAVTSSPMSPEAQRQSRKAGRAEGSGKSSNRTTIPLSNNSDAVQRKLAAAGLGNEEEGPKEEQSKSVELNTNKEGEVLLEAMAVEEKKPPIPREAESGVEASSPTPPAQAPLQERKKRPVGIIILAVLILGACGGAGAYFGTRGSSEVAALAADATTPNPTATNVTLAPDMSPPTAPPTKALKYPPPNEEDCQRIASGTDRSIQIEAFTRNHELEMEVELSSEDIELNLQEIQETMQQRFMPALAGCSDVVVRQTEITYVVFNGIVSLSVLEGASCVLENS
ncbi:MAG: hypothetical protein SGBAC_011647, partial [Bacillariaceae sp.]